MLEYTLDEADELLTKNYEAAQKQLEQTADDIGFLKDQTTTTEVSILYRRCCNVTQLTVTRFNSWYNRPRLIIKIKKRNKIKNYDGCIDNL